MSGPTDTPSDRAPGDSTGAAPPPPPPPPGDDQYGQPYAGQQYSEQHYGGQPYGAPQYASPHQQQGNGPAVTGLVLGILGVIFAFVPFLGVVLGVGLGVLAAIFGAVGLSRAKDPYRGGKGMAIAGLVLGIIAIVLSLLQGALLGAVGSSIVDESPELIEELEQIQQDLQTP